MSQQLREHARCGEPTSLKQTEPSLNAAASWTGLLAGPHCGGVPRAESARDSTGVVRLSAVETNRIVEDRRRIVTVLILGEFGLFSEEKCSREECSCICGGKWRDILVREKRKMD